MYNKLYKNDCCIHLRINMQMLDLKLELRGGDTNSLVIARDCESTWSLRRIAFGSLTNYAQLVGQSIGFPDTYARLKHCAGRNATTGEERQGFRIHHTIDAPAGCAMNGIIGRTGYMLQFTGERDKTGIGIRQRARIQHALDYAPLACNRVSEILDITDTDEFHRDGLTGEQYIGLGLHFIRHDHIAIGSANLYLTSRSSTQVVYFQGHMEGRDRTEVLL